MDSELIIISEYCTQSHIEASFIIQLEDEGLIELHTINNEPHIHISQLKALEQYAHWHYDLSINVEGIDVIRNLMNKIDEMQFEINSLKEKIRLIDDL